MKNRQLNQWLWKWHFIAGMVSIPFVLVLSITGAIYLFKDNVETPHLSLLQSIEKPKDATMLSYDKQLSIVSEQAKKPVSTMVLPISNDAATEFVSGRFGGKKSYYINPYTGEVKGTFKAKDTWMYTIRKLHGELLSGTVGTRLVELIACWMIVLVITGLYIWFPFRKWKLGGLFTIRTQYDPQLPKKQRQRLFFRDVHAVSGFWISIILIITLAGGLPWTDVFGDYFKNIQKLTHTGYPATWRGKGLSSNVAAAKEGKLSISQMIAIAQQQQLVGKVSIGLPMRPNSTFSVSNRTFDFGKQRMLHFDQYTGALVKEHTWSDVGVLMKGRMWAMAFHQGQLGGWNFWLMFAFSILLFLMSVAAICSYILRKPERKLGIPKVPAQFQAGKGAIILIVLLAIMFPLFALSLVCIYVAHLVVQHRTKNQKMAV